MSEEKNYINLAYKEKEIKISIPSNYEELKDNFCDEFEVDLPVEKMDLMIESIIKTAMSRY